MSRNDHINSDMLNVVHLPVGNLAELERMYQVFRMRTELDEGILYVLIVVMGKSTV